MARYPGHFLKISLIVYLWLMAGVITGCRTEVRYADTDKDGYTKITGTLTVFTSNGELAAYLRDQYSKRIYTDYPTALTERISSNAVSGDAVNEGGLAEQSSCDISYENNTATYTGTNLQESGVDESDVVKTDGDYLYIARDDRVIVVSATNPMAIVSSITVTGSVDSMYLYNTDTDKKILALLYVPLNYEGTGWIDDSTIAASTGIAWWIPVQAKTGVALYDITNPTTPEEIKTIEADGYLVSSRRMENYLYVVQQYLPDLPAPYLFEGDIEAMTVEELMPFYSDVTGKTDAAQEKQLVAPGDFYHPSVDGGGSIVTIATFDLNNPDQSFTSIGVVADASIVYSSTEALYCTSTYWKYSATALEEPDEQTIIYKFGLSDGRATGQGYASVNGRVLNQFSLGEYEGVLRIATTTGWSTGTEGNSRNHVYCLKSLDGALEVIGSLEDIAQGEELYSARFIGTRGFLVTFVMTDPLFTLDLSDPYNPQAVGELVTPGYSTYIHPWQEGYLITIGKDTIQEGDGFAWYRGVQLSIFDISDLADPKLIKTTVIGDRGTYSEALYNHKAFTFWESEALLALPVDLYELQDDQTLPSDYGELTFKGLYIYRVGIEEGFKQIGRISTSELSQEDWHYSNWTRGIFIDDRVYAITPDVVRPAETADIGGTIQSIGLVGN